jgi:TonB family protein
MATLTTPQSPRAFFLSALLHAIAVLLLMLFAWWTNQRIKEPEQIFELVAGEGQDYMAKEAPTTTVSAPTIKAVIPEPKPVVVTPPPTPKIERAPDPVPKETPPPQPKKETPPPPKTVEKAKPTPVPEKAPEQPKMTFDKFTKEHGAPKTPQPKAPPPITPKKIDADKIAGRVASDSTNAVTKGAGGTALTRDELADQWALYQSMLIQRIRRSMQEAGFLDLRSVRVEFRISAEGEISGGRIVSGSGSSDFDEGVLRAIRSLGRVPPPPSGRAETLRPLINLREAE